MKKLRAFVATMEFPPDIGGVGVSAKRIFGMLADTGIDIHLFAPASSEEKPGSIEVCSLMDGLTLYRVQNKGLSVPAVIKMVCDLSSRLSIDIFHGFLLQTAGICLEAASIGRKPVIASIRGIDAIWMQQEKNIRMASHVLTGASWITSVSKDSLKAANCITDISAKSSFIPNSIDTQRFPCWNLCERNRGVIGTVCTLREKKDIPLLIRAYAGLPRMVRKKLLIVGDYKGPTSDAVRLEVGQLIHSYHLESEVLITGFLDRPQVLDHLMQMNVFVLSSKHEGLPNAILEAAGCGVPIVSTTVDGIKDVFGDGKGVLLVPPGDENKMTEAILRILHNPYLAENLGREAMKKVQSLSPAVEQQTWLELYYRLTGYRNLN